MKPVGDENLDNDNMEDKTLDEIMTFVGMNPDTGSSGTVYLEEENIEADVVVETSKSKAIKQAITASILLVGVIIFALTLVLNQYKVVGGTTVSGMEHRVLGFSLVDKSYDVDSEELVVGDVIVISKHDKPFIGPFLVRSEEVEIVSIDNLSVSYRAPGSDKVEATSVFNILYMVDIK